MQALQLYLALAFVVHVGAGIFLTKKYKRFDITKAEKTKPIASVAISMLSRTKLILSGLAVLLFVVIHVWQMRTRTNQIAADPSGARDVWANQIQVLESRGTSVGYILGTGLLGWHLYSGWTKTMHKFGLTGQDRVFFFAPVERMGQLWSVLLSVGFIGCVIYGHHVANQV